MQIPVWLKPGLWGAATGAAAITIVGFSQLGWYTASSADSLAQERADSAVVTALVPYCVAKAQQDPNHATLAKFQSEQESYSRTDLVIQAGWATLGDAKVGDDALARACAHELHTKKAS